MSERRVGQVSVMVEYDPTDYRRVGQVAVMIEYHPDTWQRRVGQVAVMVEYRKPWNIQLTQGPAAQII